MGIAVNFSPAAWVDSLRRHWLPPRCLLCDGLGHDGMDACLACLQALPWLQHPCPRCALPRPHARAACPRCLPHDSPLHEVRAAFLYAFPVDRLLPRLKFHDGLACTPLLAMWMADAFADAARPQAIVPIPLHRQRLRLRGYNQAQQLAAPLANRLQLPLRRDLLLRTRGTQAQSRLDAQARRHNLTDAFSVARGAALPRHVVVFDDVMTTGATLLSAAQVLRDAGVARVDAWVCARAP